MRGLFLVVCVVAIIGMVAADICGDNGHNVATCVCNSGYSGSLCATSILSTCAAVNASNVKQTYYPSLNKAPGALNFTNNVLLASIVSPLVNGRVFNNITFVGATDPTCHLGDVPSFWAQSTDSVACHDQFTLTLPWLQHNGCGFVKSTFDNFFQYRTTILFSYTDNVGVIMDSQLTRKTRVSFGLYVNFQRVVEVKIDVVTINATVVPQFFLTQFTYDADLTQEATMVFTTFLAWPFMFVPDALSLTAPTPVTQVVGSLAVNNDSCTNTFGSTCRQTFVVNAQLSSGCTFDGTYTLSTTLFSCRDRVSTSDCTQQVITLQWTSSGSDICGTVMTTPYVSASLVNYEQDLVTMRNDTTFLIGSWGYFRAIVDHHGEQNTITLNYLDITVEDTTVVPAQPVYLYQNGFPTPQGTKVGITVDDSTDINSLTFKIASGLFSVDPSQAKVFYLRATSLVTFDGNDRYNQKKRSQSMVESVWDVKASATGSVSATARMSLMNDGAEATPEQIQSQIPSNYAHVFGIAAVGGVFVVCTVLVAVVAVKLTKRRSTGGQTLYTTL